MSGKIDEHDLLNEWKDYSNLFWEDRKRLSDLTGNVKNLKLEVKVLENNLKDVEAELSIDIRNDPTKYGASKLTEELVKSLIRVNSKRKEAQDKIFEKERELTKVENELNLIDGNVTSFFEKRKSLENITKLYFGEYYGDVESLKTSDSLADNPRLRNRLNEIQNNQRE